MTVVSSQCFNITIQTLIHCMQNNHVKWLILNENKVHWKRLLTTCTYVCIILLFHFLEIWIKHPSWWSFEYIVVVRKIRVSAMGICTHWFYTLLFHTKCWCTHLQDCVVYDEIYMYRYLWPGWNIPVRAGLSRTLCCRTDLGQGTVWLDEIPTLVGVHHFPTLSISPLSTSEKTVSCSHTTAYWALNNK